MVLEEIKTIQLDDGNIIALVSEYAKGQKFRAWWGYDHECNVIDIVERFGVAGYVAMGSSEDFTVVRKFSPAEFRKAYPGHAEVLTPENAFKAGYAIAFASS